MSPDMNATHGTSPGSPATISAQATQARDRPLAWGALPWGWLLAGLAAKVSVLLAFVPAPTVWYDESFFYATAHDLLHYGQGGAPHPNFLFYSPLVSVLTAPLHLLDIPGTWIYRLSLALVSTALWSTVVAMLLLYRELSSRVGEGGLEPSSRSPRPLVFLLLFSSVGYLGFQLMSEPLFVGAYSWFLLFFYRFLLRRRAADALAAGLAASAMVLTRTTGIGIPVVGGGLLVLDALLELRDGRLSKRRPSDLGAPRTGLRWRALGGHFLVLLPPVLVHLLWRWADARWQDPGNWDVGAGRYLGHAFEVVSRNPTHLWTLSHKILANLGYVSIATLGVAIPLSVWLAWHVWQSQSQDQSQDPPQDRPQDPPQGQYPRNPERRAFGLLMMQIAVFALFAAFAAALHMFFYGGAKPGPKYQVYGRYMEYFAPILWVLAWLALERLARVRDRKISLHSRPVSSDRTKAHPRLLARFASPRLGLVLGSMLLAYLSLAFLPQALFGARRALDLSTMTPNHLGLGWISALVETLPSAATLPYFGALLIGVAMWATTLTRRSPSPTTGEPGAGESGMIDSGGPRISPWAPLGLLLLMGVNLLVGPRQIADGSQRLDQRRAGLSSLISQSPEVFADGFYVDLALRQQGPASFDIFLAYLDHLDLARMGSRPMESLGKMPVITPRAADGYEILETLRHRRAPKRRPKQKAAAKKKGAGDLIFIYGKSLRSSMPRIFEDGFEAGSSARWSTSTTKPHLASNANERREREKETP